MTSGVGSGAPVTDLHRGVPRALGVAAVVGGGVQGFRSHRLADQSFLIVDATPLEARVFLDGHLLGSAGQLIARALPLEPGRHLVEIVLPRYRAYVAHFSADPSGFSTRIRATLRPD